MLITDEYRELLERNHIEDPEWGAGLPSGLLDVYEFVNNHGVEEFLDYGCGKGSLRRIFRDRCKVINYDPCIPQFATPPTEPHRFLVCVDVLEHIEPECIDDVLQHIASLLGGRGLFRIALKPAQEILPDGRNAHILLRSSIWWFNAISKYMNVITLNHYPGHLTIKCGPSIFKTEE